MQEIGICPTLLGTISLYAKSGGDIVCGVPMLSHEVGSANGSNMDDGDLGETVDRDVYGGWLEQATAVPPLPYLSENSEPDRLEAKPIATSGENFGGVRADDWWHGGDSSGGHRNVADDVEVTTVGLHGPAGSNGSDGHRFEHVQDELGVDARLDITTELESARNQRSWMRFVLTMLRRRY